MRPVREVTIRALFGAVPIVGGAPAEREVKDGGRRQEGGSRGPRDVCPVIRGTGPASLNVTLDRRYRVERGATSAWHFFDSRGGSCGKAEHARCRRTRTMPGGSSTPKGALLV